MALPCSEGLAVPREAGHGLNSRAVCSLRAVLGTEPQGSCRGREMCSFYLCICERTAENKGREGETPAQAAQERNESLPAARGGGNEADGWDFLGKRRGEIPRGSKAREKRIYLFIYLFIP